MFRRSVLAVLSVAFALRAEAMTFRQTGNGGNCVGCGWFVGDGEITRDTPRSFEQFTSDKDYGLTIYLNSPGGDLVAGLKLGDLIRAKNLSTSVGKSVPESTDPAWEQIVPGQCVSAYAYAFLGGVSRSAKTGEIGVHQFYKEAAITNPTGKLFSAFDLSVDQFISALVIDHVSKMGADPRIVSIASTTLPGEMHYFNDEELDELKVNWNPSVFQPWGIEPYGQGVVPSAKHRIERRQRPSSAAETRLCGCSSLTLASAKRRTFKPRLTLSPMDSKRLA